MCALIKCLCGVSSSRSCISGRAGHIVICYV